MYRIFFWLLRNHVKTLAYDCVDCSIMEPGGANSEWTSECWE